MTQVLLLFGVAVLVALNGLFVAAEFALVRASQGRIEQLRDEGRRGAQLVLKQIERIDEYLSACQLGITMTSLGIGFLGEPAIASLFEDVFGSTISHSASLAISLGLAYLITTALHITFGEQVPKIYSIVHSEQTALRVARPLELFRTVFNPLIWLLNTVSNWVLHLVGGDARRCLPPARAAGAPGDDADPGCCDRGCLRDRRGGAPARGRLGPHAACRDRGRQHRPDQGHRARELTRPEGDDGGSGRVDREQREGGADRARDEAARRPAGRSPARARVDGGGRGRVRPDRRDRDGRGHHRGGGGGDRRRDRPRGGGRATTRERRLVGPWPRADHGPGGLRARPAGGLRRVQLGGRLRLRRTGPAAQAGRHGERERLLLARRGRAREPGRGRPDTGPPLPRRGRPA